MNKDVMIKIRQLNIAFGDKVVIDDIDLDVYKGETLAIIGPSGTGKSTIMKALDGLLTPTSGSIIIDGQEVSDYDEEAWNKIRKQMGVVFQYSALFDFLTVGGNVAFGLNQHFKLPKEKIEEKVASLLELVGMPGSENLMPSELSGGMKKRVGLARALAIDPKIVLYDEPTSGLDPIMTTTISKLIRKTQEHLGVTSLLVTHDMESCYVCADRIAMLYKGKIVQVGTVEEIKNSSNPIVQAFIHGWEFKEEENDGDK